MKKLSILEMNRLTEKQFKEAPKIPLTVVLDNIRSRHNIGSVFRTSDAFRIEKIVLCGITAAPPDADIHKTALGAEFSVDWTYEEDSLSAVERLKEDGYTLLAVEQAQGSILLSDWKGEPNAKYALVLGNEVKGVRQEVVDACHHCIEIPQFGTKHSLNVSVASGIVLWHFFERLRGGI